MEKNLEYYFNLPYTRELIREASGIWFVRIKELPNCMSQGNTPEEALRNIEDAMYGWLEGELEDGEPIPEPKEEEEYSGKFNLRVPKSIHRKLAETADEEGMSLNALCVAYLSEAVGVHQQARPKPEKTPQPSEKDQNVVHSGIASSGWPGLSAGAQQALLAIGFGVEAGCIDEQLFANWVERQLGSIESACQQKYYREALMELENLAFIVRIGTARSPALQAMIHTLSFLKERIQTSARGPAEEEIVMMVRKAMAEANQPVYDHMVSESRREYSIAATQTEVNSVNRILRSR